MNVPRAAWIKMARAGPVSRETERADLAEVLEAGGDYDDKFRASNGPREQRRSRFAFCSELSLASPV
jgi:hypothetical protein